MSDIERRHTAGGKIHVRKAAAEGDTPAVITIRGYAAVFSTLSDNLGYFREQIAPGAFDGVLQDDVRCFFNHEEHLILGRTASGTLRLSVDKKGLAYECDLPDTQTARDLAASMERGDVDQSSFAFRIAPNGDSWDEDPDTGGTIRTITKIARLYDVSPVSIPAYPDASIALRRLTDWRKDHPDAASIAKRNAAARARILKLRGMAP